MPPHIAVVGSLNTDLVVVAPRHPRAGETLIGGPFHILPGGKGANQAAAAGQMGARVSMIGCVGADAFGDQLLVQLAQFGVDTGLIVRRQDESTGVALITVSAAGENTIVVVPGANGTLSPEIVAASAHCIARADILVAQLEIPMPALQAAVEIADEHHVPVILNPAPAQPLPPELLARVACLIPNESEAALLTGLSLTDETAVRAAAVRLQQMGARSVVVTLGARGALVAPFGETPVIVPSFSVDVVDTTAAGDAFVAALAVALSEGRSLVEAARWGCAAGALACTVIGAQPSLPPRAAVEALLRTTILV